MFMSQLILKEGNYTPPRLQGGGNYPKDSRGGQGK